MPLSVSVADYVAAIFGDFVEIVRNGDKTLANNLDRRSISPLALTLQGPVLPRITFTLD